MYDCQYAGIRLLQTQHQHAVPDECDVVSKLPVLQREDVGQVFVIKFVGQTASERPGGRGKCRFYIRDNCLNARQAF